MSLINPQNKISFIKGNIAFSLLAIIGLAAFVLVGFNQPTQDIFLGAQVGKGGVTTPGIPTLESATPADGQVSLSWSAPADGGSEITDYVISIYVNGKSENTIPTKNGKITSYLVTGLANDKEYDFDIYAINAIGAGKKSNILTATPQVDGKGDSATVPSIPSKLTAIPGDGQVELSWFAPEDDGGVAIEFYYVKVLGARSENVLETNDDSTSYVVTGLTNDVEYVFSVAAANSEGESDYSNSVSETPTVDATVPNTPTGITLTPGDQTLSISWTTPSNGGSDITGYIIAITPSGGDTQTVNVDANSNSYLFEGLKNGTAYLLKVLAQNSVGDSEYSTEIKSSPDENTAPAIVGKPTVQVTNTNAIITWFTNKSTSTKVDFGLLSTKTSTPEYNKNTRVVEHSVTIVDLLPCTTYSFAVKSYDSLSQVASGGEQKFTTAGCVTTAEIQKVKEDVVDTTIGGTLDFVDADVKTKLEVPQNLKAGESEVVFQVKLLEKLTTKEEIGLPEQKVVWVGDHVYDFSAYSADSEQEVNNFDQPITVTIEYTREDIKDIDLNTLVIHHYEEELGWRKLSQCVNDYDPKTGLGEISCDTNSFSVFGLFGETARGRSETISTGTYINQTEDIQTDSEEITQSSAGGNSLTTKESTVVMTDELKTEIENDLQQEDSSLEKITIKEFNRDLWYGTAHLDVINLQKFLNQQGFTLAESGPGSPGRETAYFGDRTFRAVKNFQIFYQDSIVAPTSFQKASGYLDYFTRQFIQENF